MTALPNTVFDGLSLFAVALSQVLIHGNIGILKVKTWGRRRAKSQGECGRVLRKGAPFRRGGSGTAGIQVSPPSPLEVACLGFSLRRGGAHQAWEVKKAWVRRHIL